MERRLDKLLGLDPAPPRRTASTAANTAAERPTRRVTRAANTSTDARPVESPRPPRQAAPRAEGGMLPFKAWRASPAGKVFAGERRRRESQFESAAARRQQRARKDAELDKLLGLDAADPMQALMQSVGVDPNKPKGRAVGGYAYPSDAQLKDAFGPAGFTSAPGPGAEPPRNPHMMECIAWKRRGECEKWANTGWCPFDHPSGDSLSNEQVGALKQAVARIKRWLEAAHSGNSPAISALLADFPDLLHIAVEADKERAIPLNLTERTALNHAALNGHQEVAPELLLAGHSVC